MRFQRHLSFLLMAVAAAAISVGLFARGGQEAAAVSFGAATFTAVSPGGSTAVGNSVDVPINLTSFTPGISTKWGGYDLEVKYDDAVVNATADTEGGSNPCGAVFWANTHISPSPVASGCAFQSSTYTGLLETITFQCVANGTSAIQFVLASDVNKQFNGSQLFDETANAFDMTFVDASITCGTAPTATFTNTATATNTPLPTNTATATRTPTQTSTPLPGGTLTAIAGATQTAAANFGGAKTATPTPGGETPTDTPTETTAGGSPTSAVSPPAATATSPGGGAGGQILLPDTGNGGGVAGGSSLWLILGGVLATLGGGLFVTSRRVR